MSYRLMAYNKDRDVYNKLFAGDLNSCLDKANETRPKIGTSDFIDETGEPYDWLEIWDDDMNVVNIIVC